MARKTNSVPHRCLKCQAEGSIYGRLIFAGDDAGNCPHHINDPLVPSPRPARKWPSLIPDGTTDNTAAYQAWIDEQSKEGEK